MTGFSTVSVVPWGGFISSTMTVMITASTPSLKASKRPFVISSPPSYEVKASIDGRIGCLPSTGSQKQPLGVAPGLSIGHNLPDLQLSSAPIDGADAPS